MRIGVFGGSFDPPHTAHAAVADAAYTQLKLDRVLWIPTAHPPHKQSPSASFQHRLGMVSALIQGNSGYEVSDIESSLSAPSYMLQTLRALKTLRGSDRDWFLILGSDNWAAFPRWHEPDAVLAEAELALYPRAGAPLRDLPPQAHILNCPEMPEASQALREQFRNQPEAALARLPAAVAQYIRRHGLYGLSATGAAA